MDALGEGRFPQSLGPGESLFPQSSVLSVAASFVLVLGSLYLLTSTASWSPQRGIETEASTPSPANRRAETETPVEVAWAAPGQALTGAAASAARGADEAVAAATQPASQEPEEPIDPASSSAQAQDPAAGFGVTPIPEALAPETKTITPESTRVSDASVSPDNLPEISALPETTAAESADPKIPVAADTTAIATDQIGQLIARSPPSTLSTRTIQEDTGDVPDRPVIAQAAPSEPAGSVSTAASDETTAKAPRSSKPKQESQAAQQTVGSAPPSRPEALKQTQARPAPAQQVQAQPRSGFGFRLPMALAPANNPAPAQAAKPRPSRAAYSRKVWAALARSKPRAGQKGSATVMFTIGAGGGLGGARISRSSGNTRIDQLALATVRRAAPFPAPPSGRSSFSIRIDFH